MQELYESANQRANAAFQSFSESLRASEATSSTSTVRQGSPRSALDQALSPPDEGLRTTATGTPSQESQPITLSDEGLEEVSTR